MAAGGTARPDGLTQRPDRPCASFSMAFRCDGCALIAHAYVSALRACSREGRHFQGLAQAARAMRRTWGCLSHLRRNSCGLTLHTRFRDTLLRRRSTSSWLSWPARCGAAPTRTTSSRASSARRASTRTATRALASTTRQAWESQGPQGTVSAGRACTATHSASGMARQDSHSIGGDIGEERRHRRGRRRQRRGG